MMRSAVLLLPLAALSCGDGRAKEAAAACHELAEAFCARYTTCFPSAYNIQYGDTNLCVERTKINCPSWIDLEGSALTIRNIRECVEAYRGATCAEIFQNNLPAACRPMPGKLPDGASCGVSYQCASTSCVYMQGQPPGCGKCTPRAREGESCLVAECQFGLYCNPGNKRCLVPRAEMMPCNNDNPCKFDLTCKNAGMGMGMCAKVTGENGMCTMGGNECDAPSGHYCNLATRQCKATAYVRPGSPCGNVSGTTTLCLGGTCTGIGMTGMGTCTALVREGGKCDAQQGLYCLPPALCANGTCQITDPVTCR
jgi:hypothetical protein